MNQEFWNTKYGGPEFHYGEAPNRFLELMLESRPPGRLLFPAEGEGRNAVYAARLGWEVHAFDISEKGRAKALALAKEKGVEINYNLTDALAFQSNLKFDAIALIYAHFPSEIRAAVHHKMTALLKPVGELWLEAFSPGQLSFNSGGPKDESMEARTVRITANGKPRIKSPAVPGRNIRGRKAIINVAVKPKTAMQGRIQFFPITNSLNLIFSRGPRFID